MDFRLELKKLKKNNTFYSFGAGNSVLIGQISRIFDGAIPPSYRIFLEELGSGNSRSPLDMFDFHGTGAGDVASLVGHNGQLRENEEKHQIPVKTPKHLLEVSNMGDDVTWFFDLSQRRSDGECKVIGYICGLPEDQQPEWVKTDESFDTFEDFFRSKTGLLDRAS